MSERISVFGAGSWGTALAQSLARNGHEVVLWCHRAYEADAINRNNYHPVYLTDFRLSPLIHATPFLADAAQDSPLWLFAVPTQHLRGVLSQLTQFRRAGLEIANAAKGAEISSLKFISQIAAEIIPEAHYTVLSGPSHAEEAIRDLPLAIVSASTDLASARLWQHLFNRETFRVYTNTDVIGVEVGGAVKNVIAIASGLLRSLEMGDNITAAMVTRGLAEITRFGTALGAQAQTFSGLTGIGDLMVTAYSRHSRNFRFGEMIGYGLSADEAKEKLGQVAEGIYTVKAIRQMARDLAVEMPITEAVYEVLYENLDVRTAAKKLMTRDPKPEY